MSARQHSYNVQLKRGDLVRWIIDHNIYVADNDVLRGASPNYKYGIIIEVSAFDPNYVIICSYEKGGEWKILNFIHDDFEVLSAGKQTEDLS